MAADGGPELLKRSSGHIPSGNVEVPSMLGASRPCMITAFARAAEAVTNPLQGGMVAAVSAPDSFLADPYQERGASSEGTLSRCASAHISGDMHMPGDHRVHLGRQCFRGTSVGERPVRGGHLAGAAPLPRMLSMDSASLRLHQASSCPPSWSLQGPQQHSPPESYEASSLGTSGRGCTSTSGSSSRSLLHCPHSLLEYAEHMSRQRSQASDEEGGLGSLMRIAELSLATRHSLLPELQEEEDVERRTH